MKVPRRLPYELALCAATMLGSCTAEQDKAHSFTVADYDRLDDAETGARAASERLDKINERLEAVEQRLHMDEQSGEE